MPQSVVTANSARELCDFFEKVGSNFSINKIKNESRPLYLARGKPLRRKGVVELPSQGAPIPLPFPEKTKMNNAENSELSRFSVSALSVPIRAHPWFKIRFSPVITPDVRWGPA